LWHGSRTSNFIGILTEGLRIAPPSAPVSGYAFGKGVYFADMFSKSHGYCSTDGPAFLLLCEVALGKMAELFSSQYMEKAPDGFNSCKAMGRSFPDFSNCVVLPNGVTIPLGKVIEKTQQNENHIHLRNNEFIVYDTSQVRMRYLVELK